jgi:hypothetical protein
LARSSAGRDDFGIMELGDGIGMIASRCRAAPGWLLCQAA